MHNTKRSNQAVICLCYTYRDRFDTGTCLNTILKSQSFLKYHLFLHHLESNLFFFPFHVFPLKNSSSFFYIKAKQRGPPCCEQNDNTIFFTSEKIRVSNKNADTIFFFTSEKIKTLIRFSRVKSFLFHSFPLHKSLFMHGKKKVNRKLRSTRGV